MKLGQFNSQEAFLRMPEGVAVGSVAAGAATVANANAAASVNANEEYLRNDLEKKLVLIAPSSTPIDTITREIGNTRKTKSIETGGWEVSVRDVDDAVMTAISATTGRTQNVVINKNALWQPGDTFVVFGNAKNYMFYVDSKSSDTLSCTIVGESSIPAIAADSPIIRLGKAMNEVDASTDAMYSIPSNRTNYCQIHMAQVEESVVHSLHEKEVAFDYSTIREQTIFDLKWRMEMTNLWGKKDYFANAAGKGIYTSAGLWEQIENSQILTPAVFSNADWISLTKQIFDGNNGSERRIALVGSDLMAYWANVPAIQKQLTAENTEVVLGVKFNKIITNFGELLVKCASNTFLGGNSFKGIVIDPAYIRRDVYEQLSTTPLDLDATGVRRVKAERMLENYCLYVENQPVHTKLAAAPSPVPVGVNLADPEVEIASLGESSIGLVVRPVLNADKYQVSINGGAYSDLTVTSGTGAATISGLAGDTRYELRIKAVPAAGSLYSESNDTKIVAKTAEGE